MKYQIEGMLNTAEWLNGLILLGTGTATTVAYLRMRGDTQFDIWNLKFGLRQFWLICIGLSVVHAVLGVKFAQRIANIAGPNRRLAGEALTSSGSFIFDGMLKRTETTRQLFGARVFEVHRSDTAYWVTLAFALALFVGLTASLIRPNSLQEFLKFSGKPTRLVAKQVAELTAYLAIAWGLAALNWMIGSSWAIAASELLP